MWKEWMNWGRNGKSRMRKRSSNEEGEESGSPGCMCAVFQLFNFHYYPFALHHQSSLQPTTNASFFQDEPTILKGVEAPRNSLDLEKSSMETASSSSTQITDKYLNINMGKNSPLIKTTNLVARLMGLDLLPQATSPKLEEILKIPSFKNIITSHLDKNIGVSGTVSLPETPRISISRRSDVEHHRLSLQLQKEIFEEEPNETPAFMIKTQKRTEENVKRVVKEKVIRTFGSDLTNTIKSKKDSSSLVDHESDFSGQILNLPRKESELESSIAYLLEKEYVKLKVQVQLQKQHEKSVESYDLRRPPPPQAFDDGVESRREDAMVTNKATIVLDKNLKKTPLSSHKQGQNHSSQAFHDLPLLLIKRTKQKQSYNSPTLQKVVPTFHTFQEIRQPNSNCTTNFINNSEQHHHYIQKILKRTVLVGEDNACGAICTTHFPSNKKICSTYCSTCVKYTCTGQKYPLIFHLVDELLGDMLVNLCMNLLRKRWIVNRDNGHINGLDLVERLCKKIESLPPSMNRQVLGDIHALICEDFRRLKVENKRGCAYEDEEIGECMVMDIGDYIVEELMHEMVLDFYD